MSEYRTSGIREWSPSIYNIIIMIDDICMHNRTCATCVDEVMHMYMVNYYGNSHAEAELTRRAAIIK